MSLSLTIAKRYLFAKKSTNAINIISGISVVGVMVATMALVIVLSVFNGFHDLVASFFTTFDPHLELTPTKGKSAPADDPLLTEVRNLPEIDVSTECVEDQALAVFQGRQLMVRITFSISRISAAYSMAMAISLSTEPTLNMVFRESEQLLTLVPGLTGTAQ